MSDSDYVRAKLDIYFEPDHVACQYCPCLETYSRNMCRKTGEYLVDIQYTVGIWCPLVMEENL